MAALRKKPALESASKQTLSPHYNVLRGLLGMIASSFTAREPSQRAGLDFFRGLTVLVSEISSKVRAEFGLLLHPRHVLGI
jgi:hypothetical protein